jgi:hypothetical protein
LGFPGARRWRPGKHRHEIDALIGRQFGFRFSHGLVGLIASGRVQVKLFPGGFGIVEIPRKAAGHKFDLLIQSRGHAMDPADKGTLAAAHHSHSQFAFP